MEPHVHEATSVDWQFLFNIAVGLVGLLLGFLMNRIFMGLDSLKKQDEKLTDEINKIKIALPTNYATKDDLEHVAGAIFRRLDDINDKLFESNHDGKSKSS